MTPHAPGKSATIDPWWRILDPRRNGRAKAALLSGASALAFVFLTSGICGAAMRGHLEAQLGFFFETLAFQTSDKLDRVIYERVRELQFAASLPQLRMPHAPGAANDLRRMLESLQDTSADLAWLGVVDRTGRVIAATQGKFEGAMVEQHAWFRGAREQPFAGSPREIAALGREPSDDAETSPLFLDLAVPLFDADGQWSGVLGAHVRWGWASEVRQSVLPDHLRSMRLGVTVYTREGDVLLDSGASGWSRPPGPPAFPEQPRARGAMVEKTSEGTTYLTGYVLSRGHRDYLGLGWLAVVRQPINYAFAPAKQVRTQILQWGMLLSAAAALAGWIFARRAVLAMRKVAATADRIRGGDVTAVMPTPRGRDETSRMLGALGKMVEALRTAPETESEKNR